MLWINPFRLQIVSGGGTGGGSSTDANFSSVRLLLHGDGANNGTSFVDSSTNASTMTRVGSSVTSTTQVKFGTASIATGTGNYVDTPVSALFSLGTNNFTIEFWLYGTALNTTQRIMGNCPNTWSSGCWVIGTFGSSRIGFELNTGGSVISATSYNNNQWYHYAVVRSGNVITQYRNGTANGSFTTTATNLDSALGTTKKIRIGGSGNGTGSPESFSGYIDDLRITVGVARYTANFTPPTAAHPDSV
jgi:hypothetical protein